MKTLFKKVTGLLALFALLFSLPPTIRNVQGEEIQNKEPALGEDIPWATYWDYEYYFIISSPPTWDFYHNVDKGEDIFHFRDPNYAIGSPVSLTISPRGASSDHFNQFRNPDSATEIVVDGRKAMKEVKQQSKMTWVTIRFLDFPENWTSDNFLNLSWTKADPNSEETVNQVFENFAFLKD